MTGRRSRATEAGRRVGRYRLERVLGSGASATVYLARLEGEAGFARQVALKLVHAPIPFAERDTGSLEEEVGQPLVEARVASRIRHPNVVPVLDLGRDDDDRVYLVMEYVEGASLNTVLRKATEGRRGPLPLPVGLAILDDLLAGLHAAHEARDDGGAPLHLVHRDVSPHNVIVGVDGVARLTDFGIAKVTDATIQTATGIVKGKPGYMAPEQLRGTGIDRRTDVWAAGVIAWEILAGRRLYRSKDLMSLSLEIVTTSPPSLLSVRDGVPELLDHAIARALARDAADRWDDAESFRKGLRAARIAPARREVVAAWVRGDAPVTDEDPTFVDPTFQDPTAVVPARGELTTTTPMARAEPDAPFRSSSAPPEGPTEATASVSMLEAAQLRRGARLPWIVALGLIGAVSIALLFAMGGSAPPSAPASFRAPREEAPRPDVTEGSAPQPVPVVSAKPAEVPEAPAGAATARASAAPPARGRAKPRPAATAAPSGKLMDSPYR